jgi:recombination protein RecA
LIFLREVDVPSKLDTTLHHIAQRYGEGVVIRASGSERMSIDSIPTGSLSLDIATAIGGIPRGHVTEIYGPHSCGKTTLALSTIAEAQRQGGMAVFIDMEHVLQLPYATHLGVDLAKLILVQPRTGDDAFEIMGALIQTGEVAIVVLDSIAAVVHHGELSSDMGVMPRDEVSQLIDQAMRVLSWPIAQTNTCVIFTNQLRQKLDVMFGNPETTAGGEPLKNWASLRIDVRRIQSLKVGAEIIGNRTRVRVVKNRLVLPFQTAEFDILHGQGISKLADLLDLAVDSEIVSKRGSLYHYGETSLGQGRLAAVEFLEGHKKIAAEIENRIRQDLQADVEKSEGEQETKKKK